MGIIWFLLFGLLVGFLARAIMPGRQAMSVPMTLVLGVAGSLLGGFVASLFTHRRVVDFDLVGVIGSVIGALLVLVIYERAVASRGIKRL